MALFGLSLTVSGGLAACSTGNRDPPREGTRVDLPRAPDGVDLDDLSYSRRLRTLLVPARQAGLALIDPDTGHARRIVGFASADSADEGGGLIYVTDRQNHNLTVVDPDRRRIVASVKTRGRPDYVRYVRGRRELWVTIPGTGIQIFRAASKTAPTPAATALIAIPPAAGGPEGIAISARRHRAYVHLQHGAGRRDRPGPTHDHRHLANRMRRHARLPARRRAPRSTARGLRLRRRGRADRPRPRRQTTGPLQSRRRRSNPRSLTEHKPLLHTRRPRRRRRHARRLTLWIARDPPHPRRITRTLPDRRRPPPRLGLCTQRRLRPATPRHAHNRRPAAPNPAPLTERTHVPLPQTPSRSRQQRTQRGRNQRAGPPTDRTATNA